MDDQVGNFLIRLSETASRRSFITKVGRLTLLLTGASLANALPFDRREAHAIHESGCRNRRYCGMNGTPCACVGGSDSACPQSSCRKTGTAWYGCCNRTGDVPCMRYYFYKDCCSDPSHNCSKTASTTSTCGKCHHGPTNNWCGKPDGAKVVCTMVIDSGSCGTQLGCTQLDL